MASGSTPAAESSMSESGPRNFYCHQCNSRTRVSAEEFTCASCGSGFIEEIVDSEPDEGREGGPGGNSDDPWAHDSEFEADAQEMFGPHSMIEHIFAQALGPGIHSQGGGSGPTIVRATRRGGPGPMGTSRGPSGTSIFVGSGGPGDQFLQSLLSNLTGMNGPGQFQFMMGGPPGSNVMYGNPGDYAWGRGGFDAIVTQLLNQMEGAGPPRMEKEDIGNLPAVKVTQDHIDHKTQCSVCWEDFVLDESVRQLECEHIFHKDCITPWLELHATCPVCRKPQNEAAAAHSRQVQNEAGSETGSNLGVGPSNFFGNSTNNDDNDSPMMEERSSQDPTPSTSTTASARRPNSTTNSSDTGPSTVPAEAEAAYSLGNPISTILNQLFGQASPSSSRSSRNQFSFSFPSSSSSSTNPSQSNAFSQATSTSTSINGESANGGQNSPIPPLVDVSSSSSTETGENCNSSTPNGSRSSLPSADSSTGSSRTRLNTNSGRNPAASGTSPSSTAPTDFQDLDLE